MTVIFSSSPSSSTATYEMMKQSNCFYSQNATREAPRTILPPISSFNSTMPVIALDFLEAANQENLHNCTSNQTSPIKNCNIQSQQQQMLVQSQQQQHARPAQFTIEEDLEIVKCVFAFYKPTWNQRIPWSFWQVYRKTTGSQRSNSSLYHHWEGSICKKYGVFINSGRLEDCIRFIEAQIAMEIGASSSQRKNSRNPISNNNNNLLNENQGTPLGHRRAQTQLFQENGSNISMKGTDQNGPSPLLRNFSMPGFGVNPPMYPPIYQ